MSFYRNFEKFTSVFIKIASSIGDMSNLLERNVGGGGEGEIQRQNYSLKEFRNLSKLRPLAFDFLADFLKYWKK